MKAMYIMFLEVNATEAGENDTCVHGSHFQSGIPHGNAIYILGVFNN